MIVEDTKPKNNQWSPEQVYNKCDLMEQAEKDRALDRALINRQFNGNKPFTAAEVEKYQVRVNVNFGEGKAILIPAINQLNNALIFKDRFFTAVSKGGKPEKKQEFGDTFTRLIHEPLKTGMAGYRQMMLLKSRNANVALHGIGPILWMNGFRWRGRYIPLEDLLIPTDTLCDFTNLMFFGVNLYLTSGEFFDMACADKTDSGWDRGMVNKIIKDIIKPGAEQTQHWSTLMDQPEKMVEWLKQNRCYWDNDATATVKLRLFFYKHHDTKKWYRCVVLREGTANVPADKQGEFLYDSKKPCADSINHILHVQYGDNSICAPLKYHSVRGLGTDLYAPVELNNRVRSEFYQHVFNALKALMRISSPLDRDRPKVVDLGVYSVVEDGVSFVKQDERHEIDPKLIDSVLSGNKQLMGESSSSYVKDVESATSQPRTATETNVLANQATESVSNMLQSVYAQEEFYWEEEVRRFCDPLSEDDEVKEFQSKCVAEGIPKALMKASNWSIKIERVLGGGDQVIATQEASALLGQSQRYDPNSQRIILRKWTTTVTRDPKMGELLVPDDPNRATPGTIAAEDVFGTLMEGIPASIREGIDRTSYVESLLGMLGSKIEQITQIDNMGSPQELVGLQTVVQHINKNIEILAKDQDLQQKVKLYSDELGKWANLIKAFGQRQEQAARKAADASQINPEAQAKAEATAMLAQSKMQISEATAAQKMEQRQAQFEQKMQQDIAKHQAALQKQLEQFQADLMEQGLRAGQELEIQEQKAEAERETATAKSKVKTP